MSEIILAVEHLKKQYRTFQKTVVAVNDVSFQVREGEVFCIVGESGCGKTTIGKSIVGLHSIDQGNISFRGECIASESMSKVSKNARYSRMQIQMVLQDSITSLNPRMKVKDIVEEGLIIRKYKDRAWISEQVMQMIQMVGLSEEQLDTYPHQLSQGQRQRVGIARTLIVRPEVLIADEPVSSLDASMQAQILRLLVELKNQMNLTMVMITHDLSVVRYFADRIAVMYQGKIVELATTEELFHDPIHPYSKALFSAIPIPDPYYEKHKKRFVYDEQEDECNSFRMMELKKDHFVLSSKGEK